MLHQKRIRKQQENEGKTKIKVMFSWWWLTMIPIDFFIIVDHHFGKARLNLYWRTLSKYHHTSVMESVALAVHFIKYPLYSYHFPWGMRNIFEIRTLSIYIIYNPQTTEHWTLNRANIVIQNKIYSKKKTNELSRKIIIYI